MGKIKVLVADSSAFMRIILNNALEQLGFEVVAVARNGKEALEMYAARNPDITLVDVALEGIDGIDVVRTLTAKDPSAAVALLIPEKMDDPDVIVEAVRAGAKSYIRKPLSSEEISQRLSKLVKRGDEE